jgi:hypothetical protein
MAELWGADPSIKIFPYLNFNRESNNTYLDSVISFKNLSRENFTDFFHGGYPLFAGGMRTCQILMTHSKPFKDLVRNVSHYLQRVEAGFFKKSLQTEMSMTIGWAYMSTTQMDRELLAEQLSYLMGIPVGLQWRMIFTERPPEGIAEKDKVRAIHFEVEDNDVPYAKKALAEIYHHQKLEGFPLGIRFRFVPDFQRVTYSQDKDKIRELIGMQQTFQDKIGHTTSSDIWSIDANLAVDELTVGDVSTIATSKSLSGKGEGKQRKQHFPRSETGQQKIVAFDDEDSLVSGVHSVAQSATQSMASIVTTAELDQKLRQQSLELEKKVTGQIEEVRLQQMAMRDKQQQQFEAQQRQFEIQQQQFEVLQKILAGSANPTGHVNTTETETVSTLTPILLAAPAHVDESGQLSL